ncbi:MAG: dihydroxy-acid dehydratase [Kiloniellaceae bacterium]|nr:dihydroxy-acid dehydratase [Kiloniellaceae bacterium]
MIGRDSKADLNAYGFWPWITGLVVAAVLIGMMFVLARGFA